MSLEWDRDCAPTARFLPAVTFCGLAPLRGQADQPGRNNAANHTMRPAHLAVPARFQESWPLPKGWPGTIMGTNGCSRLVSRQSLANPRHNPFGSGECVSLADDLSLERSPRSKTISLLQTFEPVTITYNYPAACVFVQHYPTVA